MNTRYATLRKFSMINERQCDVCGMIEPLPWFEQPMNETIRGYAREYVNPVKMFYKDLDEALDIWGENYAS
jgi:hypothetical protein